MKLELIRDFNFIIKIKNSKSDLFMRYNYNFWCLCIKYLGVERDVYEIIILFFNVYICNIK